MNCNLMVGIPIGHQRSALTENMCIC